MTLEPTRHAYERLVLGVLQGVIGNDAHLVGREPVRSFLTRVEATSRLVPGRVVALNMHAEWLEAVFVLRPNLSVFMADDFSEDEAYAADQVRLLAELTHAYLRGEGSLESRRSLLRRRRRQLRIEVNGREWVAK